MRSRIFSSQPAALPAGRALAARLPVEEAHDSPRGPHHAGGVVHRDDRARAGHAAGRGDGLVGQRGVEVLRAQPGRGRAARDDDLQLVVVADPAAQPGIEDQVPEGALGPLQLVVARPLDVPGQGDELGPLGTTLPELGVLRPRR